MLLRWLATAVLFLGLGGPLSSPAGGEAITFQPEAHAEVLSSPAPASATASANHRRQAERATLSDEGPTVPGAERAVAGRADRASPTAPGVAALPDPRGPPPLQLG